MAWDTEQTRRRLKEAATEEFAANGLNGTTVERIARRASVNKERLYHYFGDKEQLYAAILNDELVRIAEAVQLPSAEDMDVGEFAGRVFDYHSSHPHLARLLHWEGLSYAGKIPLQEKRTPYYTAKVDAIKAAQRAGGITDELDPADLAFMLIALAAWWFAVPQVVQMLTGQTGDDPADRAKQRAAVVIAARRLAHDPPR
ncbi:TetR family transcriptional regulator [Herbihabitans rhizosphaerae]|uniref:TetR family transcriptional regulator n=1 Tax=Herbihabitans rhizosphaerae TaxID=1872711 RepID=A0A4Q7L498_9PSEU|nr:TetR family transcriptional regulator [Herbihabitans rhizosphaerae]RZS44449.1 TetR family transcriptional regulator [Herbihabitans rhizosphaerae]